MSGRSVNLTTLFLGRLRPPKRLTNTSCTYFRQLLTTALLEKEEGETKVCCQTGYRTQDPWLTSQLPYRLRYAARAELLILIKKRKLRWFFHVSKSSGLAKTILQDKRKGRDRQQKMSEDNIKSGQEWTLPAQQRRLKIGHDGMGLLRIHLWDRIEYPKVY